MALIIRLAMPGDIEQVSDLRQALWPSSTVEEHRSALVTAMGEARDDDVIFVALDGEGRLQGFAEATLRRDYVNGCETSPVAFLEGIYVRPDARLVGVGRALASAVAAWGRDKECKEMASDALLENRGGHIFHEAVGFEETERVVYYRQRL